MFDILSELMFKNVRSKRDITFVDRENNVLTSDESYCPVGYVRFSDTPEVVAAINKIADLVSNMSLHLLKNTSEGDQRVINGLSKVVDISPNRYQTGKNFINWIVRTMLLNGDGNCIVLPITRGGLLKELLPIPYNRCSLGSVEGDYNKYSVIVDRKNYSPDRVLHFKINPSEIEPYRGTGYRIILKDILHNINQSNKTRFGFLNSNWKPPVIISVDSFAGDLASQEGREDILNRYITQTGSGKPWVIPADLMKVDTVKPLSLKDLAINESVEIDKKTVASVLGVPPFLLGVGEFKADEYNNFIDTTIFSISKVISEELTRKLLVSDNHYFKFNHKSLYSFNFEDSTKVYSELYTKGLLTGNEVRNELGYTPMLELEKLVILENYIPVDKVGDQSKLKGCD